MHIQYDRFVSLYFFMFEIFDIFLLNLQRIKLIKFQTIKKIIFIKALENIFNERKNNSK